mgnify:FL=1
MLKDNKSYASNVKSNSQSEFLSRKEVAKLFGVSLTTIWSWGKKGILSPKRIGNRILFVKSQVLDSVKPVYPSLEKDSYDGL